VLLRTVRHSSFKKKQNCEKETRRWPRGHAVSHSTASQPSHGLILEFPTKKTQKDTLIRTFLECLTNSISKLNCSKINQSRETDRDRYCCSGYMLTSDSVVWGCEYVIIRWLLVPINYLKDIFIDKWDISRFNQNLVVSNQNNILKEP
jgi:hypothetical protein